MYVLLAALFYFGVLAALLIYIFKAILVESNNNATIHRYIDKSASNTENNNYDINNNIIY